ncbi:hypothetical protein [Neobacillus massiliamazoniensis]|uniref:Hydrolase n=1 Tax=Neobacillus massiliamazoniensis TaxID=1499688 RepID=A0A0U1P0X5_9BACI|nr:hypothetical protein [Neobacillus massiliamazoniensis]CRK83896.1 hydrolase [Neobacillus massiliamazoniensis]
MRIFLILVVIFLQCTSIALAGKSFSGNVEKIDLNIRSHEMAISFFRLSDGEATLIQGPNNQNILVNVGGGQSKREMDRWLSLYDVKKVTMLILTGAHALHLEQVNHLVNRYHIKEIASSQQITKQIAENLDVGNQIVIKSWKEETKTELFPELSAVVQYVGSEKNEGLDFTLQFFKHHLFLMSSFSQHAKEKLLTKNLGEIKVFKVPANANEDLLSEKLVKHVDSQISILTAGGNHHPNPELISDLLKTWSEVYFTKTHGTVTIKFTKSHYEVFTILEDGSDYKNFGLRECFRII